MPDTVDAAALAGLPVLEGVDRARLDRIAAALTLRRLAPGEVLGREGEPGATFWLVLDGSVISLMTAVSRL